MNRAFVYCYTRSVNPNDWRSNAAQEAEGRDACRNSGWQIAGVFSDHGIDRSGYEQMTASLHEVDILVVHDIARFSRSLRDLVDLRDLCADHGVDWCVGGSFVDPREYIGMEWS